MKRIFLPTKSDCKLDISCILYDLYIYFIVYDHQFLLFIFKYEYLISMKLSHADVLSVTVNGLERVLTWAVSITGINSMAKLSVKLVILNYYTTSKYIHLNRLSNEVMLFTVT